MAICIADWTRSYGQVYITATHQGLLDNMYNGLCFIEVGRRAEEISKGLLWNLHAMQLWNSRSLCYKDRLRLVRIAVSSWILILSSETLDSNLVVINWQGWGWKNYSFISEEHFFSVLNTGKVLQRQSSGNLMILFHLLSDKRLWSPHERYSLRFWNQTVSFWKPEYGNVSALISLTRNREVDLHAIS